VKALFRQVVVVGLCRLQVRVESIRLQVVADCKQVQLVVAHTFVSVQLVAE
jgi:hypothetical protein